MKSLWLVSFALVLSGCAELTFHLHPDKKYDAITLKVGEKKLAITQSDCISLVGGYYPSLLSEDANVAEVIEEKIMCGKKVYIIGVHEGSTNLCYLPSCEKKFTLKVEY